MKKFLIVVFITLCFSLSKGFSQDNRLVYVGSNDLSDFYYDSYTITHNGNIGDVWIKFVYINEPEWDCCLAKYRISCDDMKIMIITSTYYKKNGKAISELPNDRMEPIVPESQSELFYRVVCK